MGTRGREIIGMSVDEVIDMLNKAFVDEWLAYYAYWIGAKIVAGPMKDAVITELTEHANDELRHADMVSNRIIQLGGTPITDPKEWPSLTNCPYDAPNDPYVGKIINQNIDAEQCAISVYRDILTKTEGKDPITNNMALQIMEDEVEHEEDLEGLKEDLQMMLSHMQGK